MDDTKEIEAFVSGKVQGVFFRDFVAKKASALYITGFVENTPQGSVRVVAQGREDKLTTLIEYLRKGPFGARILNVEVTWRDGAVNSYETFEISY